MGQLLSTVQEVSPSENLGNDETPTATPSSGENNESSAENQDNETPSSDVNNDKSADANSSHQPRRPKRLDMLFDMPCVSREKELQHAWNPEDRSLNIFVKVNNSYVCNIIFRV